ncbi:MAG: hypothetical protein U9R00_03185 [Patescibacteria group bacterium]|nr:hypothetical protein [Patescibacteria group bacterium]
MKKFKKILSILKEMKDFESIMGMLLGIALTLFGITLMFELPEAGFDEYAQENPRILAILGNIFFILFGIGSTFWGVSNLLKNKK